MCTLAEEQAAAVEGALRDDDDAPAISGSTVYDGLYLLGLYVGSTLANAILGNVVLPTQVAQLHFRRVTEPLGHRFTIGPQLWFLHLSFSHCHHGRQHHYEAQ